MINKDTRLCMSLSGRPGNTGTRFHNYLYEKLGLDFVYKAFSTTDIEHAVKGIRALGIRGCAVSMPFKESCMAFVDELSESARAIDSVNTIVNDDGFLRAYNTDYIAISKLIAAYKLKPEQSVLIHGSGGMGKAVIAAFCDAGFDKVTILARNQKAGTELAAKYHCSYLPVMDDVPRDIIVNVTPIGMAGGSESQQLSFPEATILAAHTVFDVVALPVETPLINYARIAGKQTISGAEVITLQAVEQFELYTGVRPDEALIEEAAAFSRA